MKKMALAVILGGAVFLTAVASRTVSAEPEVVLDEGVVSEKIDAQLKVVLAKILASRR